MTIFEVQSKRVCNVVAPLTGEMAARSFAYHTHKTATVTNPAVIHGLYAMTKY